MALRDLRVVIDNLHPNLTVFIPSSCVLYIIEVFSCSVVRILRHLVEYPETTWINAF